MNLTVRFKGANEEDSVRAMRRGEASLVGEEQRVLGMSGHYFSLFRDVCNYFDALVDVGRELVTFDRELRRLLLSFMSH